MLQQLANDNRIYVQDVTQQMFQQMNFGSGGANVQTAGAMGNASAENMTMAPNNAMNIGGPEQK